MAKFISRCSNQVLCIKPKRNQILEGVVQVMEGEHIRFENGEFHTDDKKQIDFIKKHRLYGNQIFEDNKTEAEKEPAE